MNNVVENLIKKVSEEINGILRANVYEIGLNSSELQKLRNRKFQLREALKNCGIGDLESKNYIKSLIKNILCEKLEINTTTVNEIVNFENPQQLSIKDKFDIIIYMYKEIYGYDGFLELTEKYKLLEPVITGEGFKYEISQDDIESIFDKEYRSLEFIDKLEIVCQKIYENYRGLGIADELRDMRIDGISAGVSGGDKQFNSLWLMVQGKTVHLSFLDFESNRELERVCMNIYRFNHPGQLSMNRGYIVNEMKDHSRVVVARPPFCENYVFFVRKFDSIKHKELSELIKDTNAEIPINTLKWIVKGCQIIGITGAQGCGKTTLLMALIAYIPPAYTLRIQELAFELHLRDTYPDRNIVSFQETDNITGQAGLDLQKKTDGTVNILGEVATSQVASWLVQMSMVASLFTIFTHHAKTTVSLINYMRNSLLVEGGFNNEAVALEQVVDTIRFDVHLEKDVYGHRYIDRITEIIPVNKYTNENNVQEKAYYLEDIVEYVSGKYVLKNKPSNDTFNNIKKNLTQEEKEEFIAFFNI